MAEAGEKATLMRRFWLWRCDRCGLLTYPPEHRPDDEPDIVCECWSGPRWVRYLALHPDSPDEKDARRRARAAAALSGSPVCPRCGGLKNDPKVMHDAKRGCYSVESGSDGRG